MSDENTVLAAFAALVLAAVLTPLFSRWRKAKGKASIFAADETLEDVGFSAIMNLGSHDAQAGIDGRLVLRPPLGTRVLGPAIAALILYSVDFSAYLYPFGLGGPEVLPWVKVILWVLLAYTAFTLNVRQQVIVDGTQLICRGVQLGHQTRDLTGLVEISVHPKRPALVLRFSDQPVLYIPKFLTGRGTFIALMEEIASGNRALGMSPRRQGIMARAGF